MVRRVGALVGILLAVGVSPGHLDAHPLHSSYAEVSRERTGNILVSVRLFADDFTALVDSLRKSSGGQSHELVARQYVQRHLAIATPDGKAIATEWCGLRSEISVVWVCVRSTRPVTGALRIRNALMFDRFDDQISIIRWTSRRETRTLVLSARVPEATLN